MSTFKTFYGLGYVKVLHRTVYTEWSLFYGFGLHVIQAHLLKHLKKSILLDPCRASCLIVFRHTPANMVAYEGECISLNLWHVLFKVRISCNTQAFSL